MQASSMLRLSLQSKDDSSIGGDLQSDIIILRESFLVRKFDVKIEIII